MPKTIEMIVSLKVPDNTAITALQTLKKLGFKIKNVARSDYYQFSVTGDVAKFKAKISKTDVVVNANKHYVDFELKKDDTKKVLVKDSDDDGSGLLLLLKDRLGLNELKKASKSTLWSLDINDKKEAERAAKELLVNEHYQEFSVL